ncbi:MAG: hypothetical protein JXQ73_24040 [Phycisphaerae bacterium]|nr:hypothetical protein [Phycisphaerae bacterium]
MSSASETTSTTQGKPVDPKADLDAAPGPPASDAPRPDDRELTGIAAIEAEIAEEPDQEDPVEEVVPATEAVKAELPEELMRIVDQRITAWRKLLEIDDLRGDWLSKANDSEVRGELARQSRELQRCPCREILENTLKKVHGKFKGLTGQKIASPQASNSVVPAAEPNASRERAYQMGGSQIVLLLKRAQLDEAIPPAAMPAFGAEPLLKLCRVSEIDADSLFGWTYYALGVQQRIDHYRGIEDHYRERVSAAKAEDRQNNKGLRSIFGGKTTADQIPPLDSKVSKNLQAARREMRAVEPYLTDLFWTAYQEIAWLYAQERLTGEDLLTARAFLRYGLVCVHPSLIDPQSVKHITDDCAQDVYEWVDSPDAMHVVYADEYILAIAKAQLTVSPDEELELNGRDSDEWKADRVWRQAVISKVRARLFEIRHRTLQEAITKQQEAVADKQKTLKDLRASGKRKTQAASLEKDLAAIRPQIGRLVRAADYIEAKAIPRAQDQAKDADSKFGESAAILTPEMIARREAKFVRQMARLSARLKEPFAQFTLRDHFHPGRGDHHSRQEVLDAIRALEKADERVFHHTLVSNKHLDRQITVRMSPTLLIAPGRGQMGFSICPRKWDDNGRFVMPLIPHRPGILEGMLINLISDFRWDCSKEEAGMDWLSADAFCAAYATARWNVRKLSDKSQKSMGFDRKLKDKPNWRAHYKLFIKSAEEQGRMLFVRCCDVYKIVLKYIGLPGGQEPLKRD